MSLPYNEVAIANVALDYLGEARINSISPPGTDTEVLVSRHFARVRRAVIRKFGPPCARKRAVLSRVSTPSFDYTDAYKLPADYVHIRSIGGKNITDQILDYDIEGDVVMCNNGGATSLKIRYLADITEVKKWDSAMLEWFALELAVKICVAVTADYKLLATLNNMLALEVPDSIGSASQAVPPKQIDNSPILDRRAARLGGSTRLRYPTY